MADDDIRGGEAVALLSLAGAVTVLRRSEDLLPVSEEMELVAPRASTPSPASSARTTAS